MTACHDEPSGDYRVIRVARSGGPEAGTVAAVTGDLTASGLAS